MALFTALTPHFSAEERRRTAIKTVIYAGAVLLGSIVIGQVILGAMGIRLVSFQLAGGVILFLFDLQGGRLSVPSRRQARAEPVRQAALVFQLCLACAPRGVRGTVAVSPRAPPACSGCSSRLPPGELPSRGTTRLIGLS